MRLFIPSVYIKALVLTLVKHVFLPMHNNFLIATCGPQWV